MAGTAVPVASTDSSNLWLDGILWGKQWDSGADPGEPTVVTYYIGGQDGAEVVTLNRDEVTALVPSAAEVEAMEQAMAAFEAVCNVQFVEASAQEDADIIWAAASNRDAQRALGWANPPGTAFNPALGEAQSLVVINQTLYDPAPGEAGALVPGGFDYITFIHEFGHAMGLAHPHDDGGQSSIFPGVEGPFDDYGELDMNQGIFTMMSYNDGYPAGPLGPSPDPTYGFELTPMALDIAALQAMYGANMGAATGDDAYALPDRNVAGTGYACIWDAGGTDEIVGTDKADAIDLRAATLKEEKGGGGFLSSAEGVYGGLTIANGAVIENASGQGGADLLRGNEAANWLKGGEGGDDLKGSDGGDTLGGGKGNDVLTGGKGADRLGGGEGDDDFVFVKPEHSAGGARDTITDFTSGSDDIAVSAIDADAGLGGDQAFRLDAGGGFAAGEVRQTVQGGSLLLEFNTDADAQAEMAILLQGVTRPLLASDFIL